MYYEPSPEQVHDSDLMLEYADALLWADAGTGKTVTAMEALRKGGYDKVMVICPKLALTMWKEELEKHMGVSRLTGYKYYAKVKRTGGFAKGESLGAADALVTTFGIARSWMQNPGGIKTMQVFVNGGQKGDKLWRDPRTSEYKTALIIDEAHYLKSRDAKQTRAVFGPFIIHTVGCVQHYFTSTWQLTGTPVTRYFDDLWTQLRAVRPEALKYHGVYEYEQFVHKFCTTKLVKRGSRTTRVVSDNKNHALMRRLLEDCYVIQRKLVDLPPITHRTIEVSATAVPKVTSLSPEAFMKALNNPASEHAKARRLLGLAKVDDVVEYVREHGQQPILLGIWHKEVGEAYRDAFAMSGMRPEVVDGSTSSAARDLIRERFNAGDIPVLIGQMQAMSTSWNLQEMCSHVIISEELPSPAMLHQFYSRVYRRGQQRHVQVDHCRSPHEMDINLRSIRERKDDDNKTVGL